MKFVPPALVLLIAAVAAAKPTVPVQKEPLRPQVKALDREVRALRLERKLVDRYLESNAPAMEQLNNWARATHAIAEHVRRIDASADKADQLNRNLEQFHRGLAAQIADIAVERRRVEQDSAEQTRKMEAMKRRMKALMADPKTRESSVADRQLHEINLAAVALQGNQDALRLLESQRDQARDALERHRQVRRRTQAVLDKLELARAGARNVARQVALAGRFSPTLLVSEAAFGEMESQLSSLSNAAGELDQATRQLKELEGLGVPVPSEPAKRYTRDDFLGEG